MDKNRDQVAENNKLQYSYEYNRYDVLTKNDFINFLHLLKNEYIQESQKPHPDDNLFNPGKKRFDEHEVDFCSWENIDLVNYLEAMEAWACSMDGAYMHAGEAMPEDKDVNWREFADVLLCAKWLGKEDFDLRKKEVRDLFSDKIQTRAEFIKFLEMLWTSYEKDPSSWNNKNMEDFFEAMITCVKSMDDFYLKLEISRSKGINWRVLAKVFLAATVQE